MASAHGDLQSVLSNPDLNSLLGGKNTVTLGDDRAKQINKGDKVRRSAKIDTPISEDGVSGAYEYYEYVPQVSDESLACISSTGYLLARYSYKQIDRPLHVLKITSTVCILAS